MAVLVSFLVLCLTGNKAARLRADEAGRCWKCSEGVVLVVDGHELRIGCFHCGWWEPMGTLQEYAGPAGQEEGALRTHGPEETEEEAS